MVALAVTREGLPVRSWVFPGNTSDVDTVKKVREDLRGWKLGRALFVADSGINSAQTGMSWPRRVESTFWLPAWAAFQRSRKMYLPGPAV